MKGKLIILDEDESQQDLIYIPVSRLVIEDAEGERPCGRFLRPEERFCVIRAVEVPQQLVIDASLNMHAKKREAARNASLTPTEK